MRILCIEKNNLTDPDKMEVQDWYQYGVEADEIKSDGNDHFPHLDKINSNEEQERA